MDDIVTRLRDIAARCWCAEKSQGEPVGKPFFRCESCDDQLQAADEIARLTEWRKNALLALDKRESEIERLRAAGDALVAAIRNHDLTEAHMKAWQEARRG